MKRWLRLEPLLGVFDRITKEHLRIAAAWVLVITTVIWVAAMLGLIAKDEPPIVLHLSFAAFWVSAATLLVTTDIEKQAE